MQKLKRINAISHRLNVKMKSEREEAISDLPTSKSHRAVRTLLCKARYDTPLQKASFQYRTALGKNKSSCNSGSKLKR